MLKIGRACLSMTDRAFLRVSTGCCVLVGMPRVLSSRASFPYIYLLSLPQYLSSLSLGFQAEDSLGL
jgi:hypothetical protein